MCDKYEKILDQGTKHILHNHKNIQEKSYKCSVFGKVTHKSYQCTLPNTSDTVVNRSDNDRDAYIESLNLNRYKSGNTGEEPCKYNDYISSFNLCSIISQHQRIHTEKKEHKNMEYNF